MQKILQQGRENKLLQHAAGVRNTDVTGGGHAGRSERYAEGNKCLVTAVYSR